MERYCKIAKADSVLFFSAQYFLELALFDSKMNQYPPSLQASAALYMAMRVNLKDQERRYGTGVSNVSCWTQSLQEHTKYQSVSLKQCAENYVQLAKAMMSGSE